MARPRTLHENQHHVWLTLDPDTFDRLHAAAKAEGVPMSAFCRQALAEALDRRPKRPYTGRKKSVEK